LVLTGLKLKRHHSYKICLQSRLFSNLGVLLKKIISISLVLIFLLHFAGFYVYFILRISEIHKEMRSQLKHLPAEKLQVLILTKADFEKAKVGDDEIKVNGKMYDIARVEKENQRIKIYCIQDGAEDNLLSFLDEVLKNASRDKKSIPSGVFTFISQADIPLVVTLPPNTFSQIKAYTPYLFPSSNFHAPLQSPPPWV
jgi:hypothetical protein